MKLYKWLFGAVALSMLGACSDHDLYPDNPDNNGNGGGETVKGYVAVEIKLPQDVGTRAEGDEEETEDTGAMNDQYGDGTPEEYKVHNALIALFKGKAKDGEKKAKFYRAVDLKTTYFNNSPEDDPLTASYISAIPVEKEPGDGETIYALVILNRNGSTTTISSDDGKTTFTLAGHKLVADETTFGDVLGYTTSQPFVDSSGGGESKFFMINAPMSSKIAGQATASDITYLTDLGSTIYDTPEKAKTNVSGCVYVERAMAKVTCNSLANGVLQVKVYKADGVTVDESVKITADVKYALSNTSNSSYVLRNVDFPTGSHFEWNLASEKNNRQRMVGTTPIPGLGDPFHHEETKLYRTYWCYDPHYKDDMTEKTKVTATTDFKPYSTPLYCKENTFQVQFQNYTNSTLAIFELDFKVNEAAKTLYIRDGNAEKIYITERDACAQAITRIVKDNDVITAFSDALVADKTLPEDFDMPKHLDISFETETNDKGEKSLIIKTFTLKVTQDDITAGYYDNNSKTKFDNSIKSKIANLLTNANALNDVTVYEGGKSYYVVPIKHFGDYYTPIASDFKGTTTADVYNNGDDNWSSPTSKHSDNFLGRYGVVRNNWYELNISKITGLGESVIPNSDSNLSDDNNEDKKYFAVEIHILSWSKRLQDVQF